MKLNVCHRIASILAFLMIISFQIFSLGSEFLGNHNLIASVKKTIFYSIPLLIILMIISAITSKKLAELYPNNLVIQLKVKRMKLMGLNGIIFLMPLAILLNYLAQNGMINTSFYLLQCLEIICGLINVFIFIMMFIDDKKNILEIQCK